MSNSSIPREATTSWRLKAIFTGSVGNLVEWYDWYAYAAFSIYFSSAYFPEGNQTAKLLNSAAIFAVGFLMRPLGGWLFGTIADRRGRKAAMTLSVLLMSFGSLMIACTPSFHTIGYAAPALLVIARLLQGLSVGGEYGTSATYLSEVADANRRGFFSSFQYVTLIGGQLLALGVQMLLQRVFLTPGQMETWGWRIPFVLGALLAFTALYLRRNMHESVNIETPKKDRGSIKVLFNKHPRAVLTVVGLTMGGTLAFYTYTVYMQKFLVNTTNMAKEDATLVMFFLLAIFACIQPLFGMLSDKIGRKPLLICFGVLGTLCTVPLLTAISHTTSAWNASLLIMISLIIVSGYTSINAVVKAEMFPAEVRALGVGFPYALTVALFGGTGEALALKFKLLGHESWYYWYVTICIFISLLVYVFSRDSRKDSFMDKEQL